MARLIGDQCYICPSCGGPTTVVNHGTWEARSSVDGSYYSREMDLVKCERCGVVFAVDDSTIPEED